MLEVFTVGGGEYIVNTLNAVAAWTGGGGYRSMIRVVMIMGLAYALLLMAWNLDYRVLLNWFLQATLMYMVLMVPTMTVKVTDRTNPNLQGAAVGNVPVGLALMASFTSQVGDYLTRSAETVFVMPGALNYSTGGIIYGARLLEATQGLRINDPVLATNLQEHFRQCVFYDVMIGRKTAAALMDSPDMLAAMGPGAISLSQIWLASDGSQAIISCRDAYTNLQQGWSTYYNAALPRIARQFFPDLSAASAQSKMNEIGQVGSVSLGGTASTSEGLVRQAMLVNALVQATAASGGSSSATDTFAQIRAETQTRNTYATIASGAMKWVPLLNIVLTVVFYAMFPIIFPLMLMPGQGTGVAKGYMLGFFYLASWGPLFVVLNMIFMTRWGASIGAWQGGGLTAANFDGVSAINQDIGALAGYMIMSVPFIAAGMAKGAMSIASHSASFLAPSQRAAEEAAQEQTTGNYSYGNVSLANRTINTASNDQWNTAPNISTGAGVVSNRREDGSWERQMSGGGTVFDSSQGISQLPVAPTMSSGFQAEARKSAAEYQNMGAQKREAANQSWSAARSQATELFNTVQHSDSFSRDQGSGTNSSIERMSQQQQSWSERLQSEFGLSKEAADHASRDASLTGNASLTASLGLGGKFGPVDGSISGSLGGKYETGQSSRSSLSASEAQKLMDAEDWLRQESNSEAARQNRDSFYRETSSTQDSHVRGLTERTSASITEARSLSREASRYEDAGKRFESVLSEAQSNGFNWTRNMSQDFVQWWQEEKMTNPMVQNSGWDPGMVAVSPTQAAVRDGAMRRFEEHYVDQMKNDLPPLPSPPAPTLPGPASSTREAVTSWGNGARAGIASQGPSTGASGGRDADLENNVAAHLDAGREFTTGRHDDLRNKVAHARLEGHDMQDRVAGEQWGIVPGVDDLRDRVKGPDPANGE
ncbi:conjugal transfer protein TraG N-terminal domain-containing protein [Sphingobium sp. B11D3A]|uniref:conjugal transfer protein TraG N-terminal domain-containing protein n=1 Tax=Sphingobium sp. B11D3A TaxID=2940574 RepID=UPI00222566BC|nr:conjugal transfer protein TraG N-terminal domain-containing protein [Sphingobium sp. B11D3A]